MSKLWKSRGGGSDSKNMTSTDSYSNENSPEVEVVGSSNNRPTNGEANHQRRRSNGSNSTSGAVLDFKRHRYPFAIVWTPIPILTWLFPIIGHMGICYSSGVIRDFAGPYFVSEDNMAFGHPTKYWILDPSLATGGIPAWDRAIYEASEEYKTRMHNLICDNCHSHCSYALNLMTYNNSKSWNMVWLTLYMIIHSKFVSFAGFLKTWLPFLILVGIIVTVCVVKI